MTKEKKTGSPHLPPITMSPSDNILVRTEKRMNDIMFAWSSGPCERRRIQALPTSPPSTFV